MATVRSSSAGSDEEEMLDEQVIRVDQGRTTSTNDRKPRAAIQISRLSRKSISARDASSPLSSAGGRKSVRERRPTPIVRGRLPTGARCLERDDEGAARRRQAMPSESDSDDDDTKDMEVSERQRADTRTRQCRDEYPSGSSSVSLRRIGLRQQAESTGLSWYEKLLPNFILTMTAPLTGYENEVVDSNVDDEEYAILDRSRIRRNRRIRRRLLTFMLLAAAASVVMYTRGRLLRRVGVRTAVSSMKQRIESGLARTVQETMGK